MQVFVSISNLPIGYVAPAFPSLYWPVGPNRKQFEALYLYYGRDIWRFTVLWTITIFGGVHAAAGLLAVISSSYNSFQHRARVLKSSALLYTFILVGYTVAGILKGFIAGAVVGLLVSAIYNAGLLSMSTWIPFTWAVCCIFFDVCGAYLTTLMVL